MSGGWTYILAVVSWGDRAPNLLRNLRVFNRLLLTASASYANLISGFLPRRQTVISLGLVCWELLLTVLAFANTAHGLHPNRGPGLWRLALQLPERCSLSQTEATSLEISKADQWGGGHHPGPPSISGYGFNDQALIKAYFFFGPQNPWRSAVRDQSQRPLVKGLNEKMADQQWFRACWLATSDSLVSPPKGWILFQVQ